MNRHFEPVRLGSIELFCRAAELGGFTAAAEVLGVTPGAVSRSVGRLEARLGVRLFARTTRQVRLTEDGRVYFEQCRQALAQIEEAERALAGHQTTPSGVLRLSVPTTYGHYRVLPLLPAFTARHPQVKVEVHIANRNVDLIEEGYDLAIRLDPEPSRKGTGASDYPRVDISRSAEPWFAPDKPSACAQGENPVFATHVLLDGSFLHRMFLIES